VNPYLFATGCTRSGTTLLQRMLDSHPRLAISNDTHVVPRRVMRLNLGPESPLTDQLVDEIVGFKRFGGLGIDELTARHLAVGAGTLVGFVRALFDEFARRSGKPLAGEKTPGYERYLPFLSRMFPDARFVDIVRDGRDVALSALDWVTPERFLARLALWDEEPVAMCALWWRRQVSAGARGRSELGDDRCFLVRYEELAATPEPVLRSVAAFLDVPFNSSMVDFYKGRERRAPGLTDKEQWFPTTSGLRNWRADLAPRDVQLFQALAGEPLASLGYPLTESEISPEVSAVAERCERWWATEVGPLPLSSGSSVRFREV
jgi:hypothetical protein